MELTQLRAHVERLAEQVVGRSTTPTDPADSVTAVAELRTALTAICMAASNADFALAELLTARGAVTKRCANPDCPTWMVVTKGVGRRRRTCSDACRTALARSR